MSAVPRNYYDGLNQKLLEAIPSGARRVLELGCANGLLGRRCKELNPRLTWHGVELSEAAAQAASAHLDAVFRADLDQADLSQLEGGYDTIVIGDLLEHLREPERVLEALYDLSTEGATIVCCLPNGGHLSVIERLVAGDISVDPNGLLDRTHVRLYTPSSAFKLFLDAGWLPHVRDQYRFDLPQTPFALRIVEAAQALGIPAATAVRNLDCYQMIIVCRKWPMQQLLATGPRAPFSVIVPVNRPWQLDLNIARSPGLQEVGAQVICVQADSAAAAFEQGAAQAKHPWRVMAHQDVYFPRGTGYAVAQRLGALEQAGLGGAPVGFAGIAAAPDGSVQHAGHVIDRRTHFDHEPSQAGVSLDELAIALHADSRLAIDATLGWHLWATDLCLQADAIVGQPIAQILDVPLFHNSVGDYVLPAEFHDSARVLLAKYPQHRNIPTLCGNLVRQVAALA